MTERDAGWRELRGAIDRGEKVLTVHYACEDFLADRSSPVPVTCLAVAELGGPEYAFSIANSAPNDDPLEREKEALHSFYEALRSAPGAKIVHWNMHSVQYGFQPISDRYKHLFGEAPKFSPPSELLYDLDSILTMKFGEGYAAHPKLRTIAGLNNVHMSFFRSGKDEAAAAAAKDYGLIERSTAEKAHIIGGLLERLHQGRLKTANSVGAVSFAGEALDAVKVVLELGERFVDVQRSLKRRHGKRETLLVNDEYDAQDLLRSLLRVFFKDVRPEDYVPSHAGASSRIDFVLPEYGLAVELKYGRESLSDADLGAELIVDTKRYGSRDDVQHLLCLVFDLDGTISNPRGIESDLEREHSKDGLAVTVKIIDR